MYYVNNTNPQISVNITSPSQIINISHAKIELITNEVKVNESIESKNYLLNPGENKIFTFNLEQNLTTSDSIYFKLFAYGSQNNEVTPEGDPTNFYIKYDGVAPTLLSPSSTSEIYLTSENLDINLNFNEKLSSYEVFLDTQLIKIKDSEEFLSSYPNTIDVNINKEDLTEGANNNLTVIVTDLAGNSNEYVLNVFYRGEEIKMTLLTKDDDSALKYYYNKNYPDFFNKTIYSSENIYNLKVETSKPAICYYTDSLSSFKEFNEIPISSLSVFNSDLDKKNHTISVDASAYSTNSFKKIWVACVNIYMNNDVVYLSNSIGISNSLITLKTYPNSTIDIIDYTPKNEITSTSFSVSARTNNLAICNFKLDSNAFSQMSSANYLTHSSASITTSNGNHTLNFKCFDVLNNIAQKSYNLNIDNTKGVSIVSYSPKFTGTAQVTVNLVLSEDVLCKYSTKVESPSDFNTLKNLSGSGFNRNFSATLSNRNNIFYIYCDKGTIVENTLSIIYDSSSPVISNLVFLNNNVKSNYSGDDKKLEFKFDVNSSIPVTNYYVKVIFADTSKNIMKTFSSNDISISGDFRNASKISVIAQNEVGKNSSALEKIIQFDFEEPQISFVNNNGIVSIRCLDMQSGCDKIYYGISSTPIDCNPKLKYSSNGNFTVQKNNYVCAEAFDRVGHRGLKQELILISAYGGLGSSNNLNNTTSSNNEPLDGRNMTQLESDDEEFIDDESNDDNDNSNIEDEEDAWVSNNFDEQPQDTGINYILIAAIVLILVSVSGGGYYAYKKGYLNKELERMGIKKPTNVKVNQTLTNTPQTQSQVLNKTNISNSTLTRTKYDDHLDKLNSFVDNTIQKRKDMFDKFGVKTNTSKQKETTGAQGVKNRKIAKKGLTAEDMDDFYEGAETGVGSKTQDPNYKREAENFEEYYQKKKKSTSENNKK